MFFKKKSRIIKEQGMVIDAYEHDYHDLKTKYVKLEQELQAQKAQNNSEQDFLNECWQHDFEALKKLYDKRCAELEKQQAINDSLKKQLKIMHRAKVNAINWKREAQRQGSAFNALMATYSQTEDENKRLMAAVSGLTGRLDVYERCMGKLEQEKEETANG